MEAAEMTAKKKEKTEPATAATAAEKFDELRAAIWSVISFEKREASGLTYVDAEQRLKELERAGISGLCIVTDEAAGRIN